MNLYDDHQLEGAKQHIAKGDHLRALSMLEALLKQYPKHGEIKALTIKARKLSSLSVPVIIKTKTEEVVEDKSHPSWWRKFF
jgi:hypothetical protein